MQDSLYAFYDWLDNTRYNENGERRSDNIYELIIKAIDVDLTLAS